MEKEFNFVYITTNLVNKKQYVGDHSTNNLKDRRYIGSGQLIIKAIKKYGKKNFKCEILEFFSTKQKAFDAQEKYINEYSTLVPNGYNISPKGGHNVKDCFSTESKSKISNSLKESYKNNPELRENLRIKATGRKASEETLKILKNRDRSKWKISEQGIKNIKESASKPKSEEHKKHISEAKKGKKLTEEHKKNIGKGLEGRIPWNKGLTKETDNRINSKKRSEESKRKQGNTMKGRRKLSPIQVNEIKEKIKYMKIQDIAKEYNVKRNLIYKIKINKYNYNN
jgi:group I intron endonuclease